MTRHFKILKLELGGVSLFLSFSAEHVNVHAHVTKYVLIHSLMHHGSGITQSLLFEEGEWAVRLRKKKHNSRFKLGATGSFVWRWNNCSTNVGESKWVLLKPPASHAPVCIMNYVIFSCLHEQALFTKLSSILCTSCSFYSNFKLCCLKMNYTRSCAATVCKQHYEAQ